MSSERQKVTILSRKDLEISYYCGSGPGGQAKNKVASGVMIRHPESGAIGRAHDSRSQHDNKRHAWERLLADPKLKFWLARRIFEVKAQQTLEQAVEADMKPENLKIEVRVAGKWVAVDSAAELDDTPIVLDNINKQ